MKELIELLSNYSLSSVVIIIVLVICALLGVKEVWSKIKAILEDYSNKKITQKKREEEIDDRFAYLEVADAENKEQLSSLQSDLKEVRQLIEKVRENQNASNRASCRSAMMRLSNELIQKGYASTTESETLSDLVDVFMKSGSSGDRYVIPSVVKRAMGLDVLTDDEIAEREAQKRRGYNERFKKQWTSIQ